MGRGRRWIVSPDLIDQAFDRHDLACAEQENGEHGPLFGPSEREQLRTARNLERTEDAKLDVVVRHTCSKAPSPAREKPIRADCKRAASPIEPSASGMQARGQTLAASPTERSSHVELAAMAHRSHRHRRRSRSCRSCARYAVRLLGDSAEDRRGCQQQRRAQYACSRRLPDPVARRAQPLHGVQSSRRTGRPRHLGFDARQRRCSLGSAPEPDGGQYGSRRVLPDSACAETASSSSVARSWRA